MIRLGLTGSIGMGKSTTLQMFAEAGAAVYDADATVHALYAPGGRAGVLLREVFPDAVGMDGAVDRVALSRSIKQDPSRMTALESIVHPLVAQEESGFLARSLEVGSELAVLDVPLLYETGGDKAVDAVVVITASAAVQRARVLARPGVDLKTFELLLARQTPDAEKRARADFVIDTDGGLLAARTQVRQVMATVLQPGWKPK